MARDLNLLLLWSTCFRQRKTRRKTYREAIKELAISASPAEMQHP
jgi:hypothetical protein